MTNPTGSVTATLTVPPRPGTATWSTLAAGMLIDMDGTLVDSLVDSTQAVERQWHTFLTWYDLPPEALPHPLHGKRAEDHIRALLPPRLADDGLARFIELETQDTDGIPAVPGAAELLAALDDAGLPWAVVTSGTRPVVQARLAAAGLPQPAVVVTAEDVTRGKPDPEPYLTGATRLGVRGPLVAIEDAPAGVRSAQAAGCLVIALHTTNPPAQLIGAALTLPDLQPLRVTKRPGRSSAMFR